MEPMNSDSVTIPFWSSSRCEKTMSMFPRVGLNWVYVAAVLLVRGRLFRASCSQRCDVTWHDKTGR